MSIWLALIGPHATGKSTIGRVLAKRLGWPFDREIGEVLRREALCRDPNAHAFRAQPDFDGEVCARELARDHARAGTNRIVETWHPGNLAYAVSRSPNIADGLTREVLAALASPPAILLVQPLVVPEDVFFSRLHEPGPADPAFGHFLLSVGIASVGIAEALGLTVLPAIDTAGVSCADAVETIRARLAHFGTPPDTGKPFHSKIASIQAPAHGKTPAFP